MTHLPRCVSLTNSVPRCTDIAPSRSQAHRDFGLLSQERLFPTCEVNVDTGEDPARPPGFGA